MLAFIAAFLAIAPADESISVTVVGTLRTGIVAVGGETTGATITAKGVTWELDFGKNAELRKAAEMLNGKRVAVRGTLERRAGVEVKERWIVTVTDLQAAEGDGLGALPKPAFQIAAGRTGTDIRFHSEGDVAVVEIKSQAGIDKATIKREASEWPRAILVRLHLSGLESFRVGGSGVSVEWSVSSTGENATRSSLVSGKRVVPITKESPYFAEIRIVGSEKEIPLKAGYFEIAIPPKLLENKPQELTLQWVDFYR
jgi:hypothetical protein